MMGFSEPVMSLRNAVKLEHMSRTRIQGGSTIREQPLRQLTGHYAVHRRAAEVIEIARAKQEMLRKAEEEFKVASVDDEVWHECSASLVPTPASNSTLAFCEDSTSNVDTDHSPQPARPAVSISSSASPAVKLRRPHLKRYQPIQPHVMVAPKNQPSPPTTNSRWMYDVLNLQFEQTAILESCRINSSLSSKTLSSSPSNSIPAQIWRILSESLSRFYSRRAESRQFRELEKLEAYGSCASIVSSHAGRHFWYPYSGQVKLMT